jgi:hypothetical protein
MLRRGSAPPANSYRYLSVRSSPAPAAPSVDAPRMFTARRRADS